MWYNIVVVDKHALSIPNSLNAYIHLTFTSMLGWVGKFNNTYIQESICFFF